MKYFLSNDLTIVAISFAASSTFPEACAYDLSEFKTLSSYNDRLKESISDYPKIKDKPVESFKNFFKSNQKLER